MQLNQNSTQAMFKNYFYDFNIKEKDNQMQKPKQIKKEEPITPSQITSDTANQKQ